MASNRDLRSRVTDIVTCPICMELCDNPKSLPCLHAFCLKCLKSYFRNSLPKDEEVCPVCRTKFKIPRKGLDGLVHHFIIETLVDARTTLTAGYAPCENHKDETVKLYCFDCKTNICLVCSAVEHKLHNCQEIGKVAEDCVKRIDEDVKPVTQRVSYARKELERLDEELTKFLAQIDDADEEVEQKADELKRRIDRHASKLQSELQSVKRETCKELDSHRKRVEFAISAMESFNTYCLELKFKGKPSDITRAADDLHVRANELLQTDVTLDGYCAPYVTFRPMNIDELMPRQNIVGEVQSKKYTGNFIPSAKPLKVLPAGDEPVGGVATLGDELFVVRCDSQHVDVYDATTFNYKRQLALTTNVATKATYTHSRGNVGLAACATNKCVYVSCYYGKCIYKVDMFGKIPTTRWTVGAEPRGVSVNDDHNVLVACRGVNRIQEYSPFGTLKRTICLPSNIQSPAHFIQLSSGQYGVTHGGSPYGYCVVYVNGRIIKSFGNSCDSSIGQFKEPGGFAVNKHGVVFIADEVNDRIVVVNPESLTSSVLPIDGGVKRPWCIHLDESRQRMYIGEWRSGGRVIVLGPRLSN